MSVVSREPESSKSADPPSSFEAALVELQQIVDQLDGGALGLEDSLRQYERGAALLRHCYGLLESAERRIEILTGQSATGELETAPFDATPTHEPATTKAGRRQRGRAVKTPEPVEDSDDTAALF